MPVDFGLVEKFLTRDWSEEEQEQIVVEAEDAVDRTSIMGELEVGTPLWGEKEKAEEELINRMAQYNPSYEDIEWVKNNFNSGSFTRHLPVLGEIKYISQLFEEDVNLNLTNNRITAEINNEHPSSETVIVYDWSDNRKSFADPAEIEIPEGRSVYITSTNPDLQNWEEFEPLSNKPLGTDIDYWEAQLRGGEIYVAEEGDYLLIQEATDETREAYQELVENLPQRTIL